MDYDQLICEQRICPELLHACSESCLLNIQDCLLDTSLPSVSCDTSQGHPRPFVTAECTNNLECSPRTCPSGHKRHSGTHWGLLCLGAHVVGLDRSSGELRQQPRGLLEHPKGPPGDEASSRLVEALDGSSKGPLLPWTTELERPRDPLGGEKLSRVTKVFGQSSAETTRELVWLSGDPFLPRTREASLFAGETQL